MTLNDGRRFSAEPTVSILDAARRAGLTLEYSCRTGRCGVCKGRIDVGETALLRPEDEGLSRADADRGFVLTCCRSAASDVALDLESLDRMADLEIKTMPSRIVAIDRLAPDIVRITLRTPPASPLRFLPGQYVDTIVGGVRRSYSIANAPRGDGLIELLVKRLAGGVLSDFWFTSARPNDLLRIEGPFGTFFLRDDPPADLLFLATGTGIAPVKALLEELAGDPARAAGRRLRVYWGNRTAENFCWVPEALGIDIEIHHLLSGPDVGWQGRRDYVQEAAIGDGIDPATTIVYACGSSAMIESARTRLVALGLPTKRYLSDAFVSSEQAIAA